VDLSEKEKQMLRHWSLTDYQYSGTYMSFGTAGDEAGLPWRHPTEHKHEDTEAVMLDFDWTVVEKRCDSCHTRKDRKKFISKFPGRPWPAHRSQDHYYNMTHPEKSLMLLAPLSKDAGGYGLCRKRDASSKFRRAPKNPPEAPPANVFTSKDDPDYQALLGELQKASGFLHEKRYFKYAEQWRPIDSVLNQMVYYGVLPEGYQWDPETFDPWAIDQRYYELFYPPLVPHEQKTVEPSPEMTER
jgi:hypothetical protein